MKVKLYIEKILKIGGGVLGFVIFTFTAAHTLAGGTEDALFEALGEEGSLNEGSSDGRGARGVEAKAIHMRLSETLWNSSENSSEHASTQFVMDKIDLFKNENSSEDLRFAKEDYFDDFKEKYEKETQDEVTKDILRDNKESKIERIALAAERGEGRRAEKAERNEDKAEVKAEKKADKEEVKAEKQADKEEQKAEKGDDDDKDKDDGDGDKKGKGD